MPVVIHGGGTIEGIATGGLPDGCVDTDTLGALAVTSGKIAAAVPLGISVADQWRITSNLTGSTSYTPTNWEQVDTDGFAVLGSSMSHSSGVFTFPSTGIYQITFYTWFYIDNAYDNEIVAQIQTTTDNSSYGDAARGQGSIANNSANANFFDSTSCTHQFDVTSTSNCKVKFTLSATKTATLFNGDSNSTRTSATFIRLGAT